MKKTGVWQVLRSACVGGWLTAGLFVAVDMGVWAQESLGMAAYDGMSLDAAPNEMFLDAAPNEMFLGTALDWMSLGAAPKGAVLGAAPKGAVLGAATPGVEEPAPDRLTDDDKKTYTQAEFIESTKGGGQYINTGYTPRKGTKVVCRLLDNGTDTSKAWGAAFGSRLDYGWTRSMYLWLRRDGLTKPSYGRAGDEGPSDKSNFPFGEITTVTCQGPTCSWVNDAGTKANGITLVNCIAGQEEGYAPMLIFAVNSPNVEGGLNPTDSRGFKLYSFKIYEGTELKRDFVPCVETSSGRAGLWDLVERKFYPNNGSGSFTTP